MSAGAVPASPTRASALAAELGLFACLWRREMMRTARERTRWAGAVLQPLIFWLVMGTGMADSFRVPGSSASALQFFFPGMLAMVVLFTTIFTTISVVEDRQQGFLQSVLVAPGSRLALVLGKVAGVTTLTLAQCALFVALAPLVSFPLGEVRWGALLLVMVLGAAGLTAMNFTVAWILDSVQAYHAIMSVVLIPLWFLSGALFPAPSNWLGALMGLNPVTYVVDGVRAALSGDLGVPGEGFGASVLVLALFGLVTVSVATFACRRKGRGSP